MADSLLKLQYKLAKASFDKAVLSGAINRAEARNLKKAGAFVRRTARSSIRRVKKKSTVSKPGSPPRSHDPQGRYKRIEFSYDQQLHSVIVGHVFLAAAYGAKTIPEVHEKGATVLVRVETTRSRRPLASVRAKRAFRRKFGQMKVRRVRRTQQRVPVTYEERPATRAAYAKNLPAILQMWKDTVR